MENTQSPFHILVVQVTWPAEKGEDLPGTIWCMPPRKK